MTTSAPVPSRRVGYRVPLANREFRALVAAQEMSDIGDWIARIALAATILARTDSALLAAATFAMTFLPVVVGSALLSSLADRLPRRRVMMTCDLVRAVLIAALALLVSSGGQILAMLGLLFAAQLFTAPFRAAEQSVIPDVLTDSTVYLAGNGLVRVLTQVNQVAGLAFGGLVLVAFSPTAALLLDSVSFLASLLIVGLGLRPRPAPLSGGSPGVAGYLRDLVSGARIIAADPVRRQLVLLAWGAAFVLVAPEAVALTYARRLGLPVISGSLLMATVPAGFAIGVYLLGRVPPLRQVQLMIGLATTSGLLLVATPLVRSPWPVGLLWFGSGLCQAFIVPLITTVTLASRPEQRGLVNGLAGAGFSLANTAAFFVVGALADWTTPANAVGAGGLIGLVFVALVRSRWQRRKIHRVARRIYHGPAPEGAEAG